jgi:hypothetical protein
MPPDNFFEKSYWQNAVVLRKELTIQECDATKGQYMDIAGNQRIFLQNFG